MKIPIQPKPVIHFTKEGFEKAEKDREALRERRKTAVIDLQKAREMGDLSENGYYKAARFNLSSIDRQLRQLNYRLMYGKVTESKGTDTVTIGTDVTITNHTGTMTYHIVGDFEADPKEKKLSPNSPLGKSLMGKKVGDTLVVYAPTGEKKYVIVSIALSA